MLKFLLGVNKMKMNLTGKDTSMVFGIMIASANLTKATIGFSISSMAPTRTMAPSVPSSMQVMMSLFLAFIMLSMESILLKEDEAVALLARPLKPYRSIEGNM